MGAVQDFKDLLARYNAVMSRASYGFNGEKVTASKRQRANDAAIAILDRVNRGEQITAADKLALSRYTGQGGNLEGHDGSTGSPYEYYTPKVVASAMWDLMAQYGSAGKVLDPCSGTGIFGATAPTGVLMHSVELSPISGQINGIVNGSDTHRVTVAPFEQVAGSTEDETFDSVITNVPFGTNAMRGANLQLDSKYQQDSLEEYFILRSLDKLKAGGLAMFITPAKIMTGNSFSKFRTRFLLKADLIGAYRLPNKVFDETGADVTTDILLFRKHSKDLQAKIKDCYDNGNVTVLTESRVLDTDIVAGKYFQHEGKRFVLGKSEVGKGRYGEVERIVNDDSVANIMKAVKKFPDSRIEYAALELAEVPYVEYKNGDIQVMDGATFEYKDGQWVQGEAVQFDESLFVDPYAAFMAGVTETRMNAYFGFKTSTGKKPEKWTAQLRDEAAQAKAEGAFGYYLCCMSVVQLIANGLEKDVNYQQKYPELTNYMIGIADDFNANKYKPKGLKSLMKRVSVAFDRGNQNGLSDAWLGLGTAIDKLNMQTGVKGVYEKLVYTGQADADFSVSVASIQQLQPDFNPLTDAEYCINADGSRVTHSKDYYSGNYAEFLARINADLESATDLDIRAKLIAQRDGAKAHIKDVDVTKLNYSLKSTTVSNDLKVEFLSDYLSRNISLSQDGEFEYTGKKPKLKEAYDQFGYGGIDSNQVIEFFANRICVMLNGNAGLSLGFSVNSGITNEQHDKLHAIFKSRFDELDVTFATWLKSNIGYMANLDASINAPENKTFNLQLDDAPIEIDGFAPKLNGFVGMNSYQNEEIRRLSRRFEGICGFDVGLGKTLTALATVQNMHNIGVKKRTFIVVPKHTISKWAGDMKMAYDNTDDVLVIGSNGNKLGKASSAYYAADFNLLLKKPYRKVLMTSDAFTAIPIQANSVERYQDLASVKNKTEQIKQEGQQAKLVKDMQVNKDKYPFFEELQVDSLVFDEAQMFKNGKAGEGAFNRVKGMSLLSESALAARALSASIKSWLVRGTSPQKDGVLLLTATPFTNSPIEIITMLSLAVGDDAAKKLLGGSNIKSTDDFLSTFARIDGVDALNIAGRVTTADTFIGFTNVAMLKDAIHTVANIQTGRERGLKMPDQNDITVSLNLAENDKQTLNLLKAAYLAAKTSVKDGYGALMPHQQEALDAAMAITGDSDDRLAHPFNLISHMSNVILCGADMAMNRTVTINYNPLQTKEAAAVEKAFNAKKNTVDTERRYPKLDPKFLVKVTTKDLEDVADGVSSNEKYKILAQVELDDDAHTLTLNIDDSGALAKLIIACEKAGLELRPTVSAKVMAMLDNFKAEMANPMHNGLSKQLIFCDNVNMHHIVKLALISYCGVKAAKIGIINAQTLPDGTPSKPDTEHMQEVQDSFNGDEGFTVVIANKKAETGIDLQKGTQAIHHLTTGWTPDSVTQRNGRGLRQGNKQAEVRVYMYNANGTFDEYKQRTLANKSDWIDTLMQKGGDVAGTLIVEQELSNDDYDEMIQADTPEAMAAISQRRDDRLKQQRKETTAKKTAMMIRMVSQTAAIAKDSNTAVRAVKKALIDHLTAIDALAKRIAKGADEKDALLALCNEVAFFGIDPEKMTYWLIGRLNSGKFDVDTLMRSCSAYASSNTPKLYEHQGYDYLLKNEDHPLHQKAKMTIESAQRMAAAAREDFVNFEDSALSRDEREAIADGQAIYTDGIVWRQGGLVVHSGSMGYGLSQLNTNFKGVLSVGMIRLIPTDPEYSEPKSTNPSGWQPIAPEQKQAAIDALAAWDAQQMEKNKISTVPEGRDIYYFSQLNDQVRMVAEQRAAASLADWLTQSTVIALDTIFIEGDGGNEHYYWHDEALPLTRLKNLKHVPLVNLPFAGLLTIADGVATIENRDFHKVSRGWGGADEHLANILRACEVVNKPIYLEPSEYVPVFDVTTTRVRRDFNAKELSVNLHWHILDYAKANNIDMAEKTTPISEDDATKIVVSALEKLLKGMVSNCAELVAHLMQDAACKVVLLAGFVIKKTTDSVAASVAAVDLAALAVNGYVGMKSTQGANEKTNILRVYKEAIKAYCADEVGKKAKWDGKAEMWNYPVEVLTWLYGQSWYNAVVFRILCQELHSLTQRTSHHGHIQL